MCLSTQMYSMHLKRFLKLLILSEFNIWSKEILPLPAKKFLATKSYDGRVTHKNAK